jgi:hypothetical protein
MAQKDPLIIAQKAYSAHKFSKVVSILEPLILEYRDSFSFYYLLGSSCLYLGDLGGAELYFKKARNIKMMNADLINAQAILFLKRGQTQKAVEYYLETLEYVPSNKIAQKALEFIRKNNDPSTLSTLIKTDAVKAFYPKIPVNKGMVFSGILSFSLFIVLSFFVINTVFFQNKTEGPRADLSDFKLTIDERHTALQTDLSTGSFRYILGAKDIEKSYTDAQIYFQNYRDNASQVEINRILNSNASLVIRQKARLLMEYLKEPGFDTITDVYSYAQVSADPWLYQDCWIVWSGRVTNVHADENYYRCDFLVGYDTMQKVEGIVSVELPGSVKIEPAEPLQILGKIVIKDNKLCLQGKAVYQSIGTK